MLLCRIRPRRWTREEIKVVELSRRVDMSRLPYGVVGIRVFVGSKANDTFAWSLDTSFSVRRELRDRLFVGWMHYRI